MKKILEINGVALTYTPVKDASGTRIVATDAQGNQQSITVLSYQFDAETGMLSLTTESGVFVFSISLHPERDTDVVTWTVASVPGVHTHRVQELPVEVTHAAQSLVAPKRGHDQHLKSPLAGRVSKLMITVGQRVERGQVLLLIESMKMENELCAPGDAVIKTIFIAEADVVQPNQLLVEFEKEGDAHATSQNPDGT